MGKLLVFQLSAMGDVALLTTVLNVWKQFRKMTAIPNFY